MKKVAAWPGLHPPDATAKAEAAAEAVKPTEANLLKFVAAGNLDEVKKMLDPGSSEDHKKFMQTNIEVGGPVTCSDPATGYPPLMVATLNGRADMCDLLIKKKADLNCADDRGDSPLHRATILSNAPVIDILIQRGMSVDVRSKTGATPLHYAALRGNSAVSEMLLVYGASPTLHDNAFGSTALHFAAMEVNASAFQPSCPDPYARPLSHPESRLVSLCS